MTSLIHFMALPFLACLMMFLILSYMGIHVLMREIIFIDITLAQFAAMGSIMAAMFFGAGHSWAGEAMAFGFAIAAAAFFSATGKKDLGISLETVIGVSYAIAAAGALFLSAMFAEGHIQAEHMLEGSIFWIKKSDIIFSGAVFFAAGFLFYIFRKMFFEISKNYLKSDIKKSGFLKDFLFYSLFAVVITVAVKMGGVLLVFAFLIIPPAIAGLFFRKMSFRIIAAWGASALATLAGLFFSYRLDFSAGPSIVACLGIILIIAAAAKKIFFSKKGIKFQEGD